MDHSHHNKAHPPRPGFDPLTAIGAVLLVLAMAAGWLLAGGRTGGTSEDGGAGIALAPTTTSQGPSEPPRSPPSSQARLRPPRWLPESTPVDVPPTFATTTVVTTTTPPRPTTTLPWGSGTVRSGPEELAPSLTTSEESELRLVADRSAGALHELFISGCGGTSQGTGWAIDRFHVVTNAHVVSVGSDVRLESRAGIDRTGTVVGRFDDLDVAVVRVDDPVPTSLEWTEPGSFDVGDGLVILGWPQDTWRVTTGVVQHLIREGGQLTAVLTDASVNHGNSGGPVLDRSGRVIGVVTLGVTVPGRPQLGLFGLAYTEEAHGAAIRQAIDAPTAPAPSCNAFVR